MAIDPVKIPQNVYVEDRIVGPLTLKQTLIMAAGGGISYAIYGSLVKAMGSVSLPVAVIAWTPAALAAIFALVKVNDLSLMRICLLLLERMQKPQVRTFSPRRGISIVIRTSAKPKEEKKMEQTSAATKAVQTQTKIKELSTVIDRGIPVAEETEMTWYDEEPLEVPTQETSNEQRANEQRMAADVDENVPDEAPAKPVFPVDRSRISTDKPSTDGPTLSDLSVFRDIFPPQT